MNFEIVKDPDFTWKVFRIEDATRRYWVATFEQSTHAKLFVELLIKGSK